MKENLHSSLLRQKTKQKRLHFNDDCVSASCFILNEALNMEMFESALGVYDL